MRRRLFALVLTLACTSPAWAQVAHDGEANVAASQNAVNPSWDLTTTKTTAGSNRLGVVGCTASVPANVTGITWGGSGMTPWAGSEGNPTDGRGPLLYYIVAPPTAASTITISVSANTNLVCAAAGLNGAHQTTQDGDTSVAHGTADPATVDCTTSSADQMVVDFLYFLGAATAPSAGADQTSYGVTDQGTWFGGGSYQDAANGDTMSWTLTSPTRWTTFCAVVQPAAVAAAPRTLLLMGCCEETHK